MESEFNPDWVSPPGHTIEDVLAERKIARKKFAEMIGESEEWAARLLAGEEEISKGVAGKLAAIVGGTQHFWIARESRYRSDKSRLGL